MSYHQLPEKKAEYDLPEHYQEKIVQSPQGDVQMKVGEKAREASSHHVKRKAARDILNAILEWRGNRIETAKRRWVFELLQNAVDTARERRKRRLSIEIESDGGNVTFRHNGGYFTLDEINAVIYGGSTKPYAPDSEYLGRFGTGLLVTHVISRGFKLTGYVDDQDGVHHFSLTLRRDGDDEPAVVESIDDCYSQLDDAVKVKTRIADYWTEFTYCAEPGIGPEAIREGLDELKANLPCILAFNEIDTITIDGECVRRVLRKDEDCVCLTVGNRKLYSMSTQVDAHDVQVGIITENRRIVDLANRPTIYVGMPLVETSEYVALPFVINSHKFRPSKERDALSSLDNDKATNERLLQCAFDLYSRLLSSVVKRHRLKHLFNLVKFRLIPESRCSQNPLWTQFNHHALEAFRRIIQEARLVQLSGPTMQLGTIANTYYPVNSIGGGQMDSREFGVFCRLVAEMGRDIPRTGEEDGWMSVAEQLHDVFPEDVGLYNLEDLREDLLDSEDNPRPTFADLEQRLDLEDARQFLKEFYGLVDALYRKRFISYDLVDRLLPAQDGRIGPVKWTRERESGHLYLEDLRRDHAIPADLKDFAAKVGGDVRSDLVDNDFCKFSIVRKCVQDSMDVMKLLSHIRSRCVPRPNEDIKDWGEDKVTGWTGLFRWCVTHKKLKPGFPVIAKDGRVQILNEINQKALLIPFAHMQLTEEFEALYPPNRILNDKYFSTAGTQLRRFIPSLRDYGAFVTSLPAYEKAVGFTNKELTSVLSGSDKLSRGKHRVRAAKAIIAVLPFWDEVVRGIRERPRNAKLLPQFIVECIMGKDKSWKGCLKLACSCKSRGHHMLPCHWLAELRTSRWVCCADQDSEDGEVQCVTPSKESIEGLFGTQFNALLRAHSDELMALLPYLGFDDLDLKMKLQSIQTGTPEEDVKKKVCQLVDIANAVPDLVDIAKRNIPALREQLQKLKQRLDHEPIKDENRTVGRNVERIVKMLIEGTTLADKRFHVEAIYRGGDLEMWPVATDGHDCGALELSDQSGRRYTIEVKFTTGTRVHMSKAQSEVACGDRGRECYMVLVVHDSGELRRKLILISQEEAVPDDLVDGVREHSHVITAIHTKLGSLPNPDEIEPDINGYWIKRRVWEDRHDVSQWLETEFGSAPGR